MDMNLDPLFELPTEESMYERHMKIKEKKMKMTGIVVLQLGEFEPVQFHFRGYPLATPTSGVLCLLPKKEDQMISEHRPGQQCDYTDDGDQIEENAGHSCLRGPGISDAFIFHRSNDNIVVTSSCMFLYSVCGNYLTLGDVWIPMCCQRIGFRSPNFN